MVERVLINGVNTPQSPRIEQCMSKVTGYVRKGWTLLIRSSERDIGCGVNYKESAVYVNPAILPIINKLSQLPEETGFLDC